MEKLYFMQVISGTLCGSAQTLNEFSTSVVALATMVLAVITWIYARYTRKILTENKKYREQQYLPIIVASLENIIEFPGAPFPGGPIKSSREK